MKAITPPYADTGSHASAFTYASAKRVLFGRAAGIVVLDDHSRWPPEFHGQIEGRFEVHEIIVGKLFALNLARRGQAFGGGSRGNVKRRALVRIFAVAQLLPARIGKVQPLGQQRALAKLDRAAAGREALEFRRDLAVVARGERERFARQFHARREAYFAALRNFGGDRRRNPQDR